MKFPPVVVKRVDVYNKDEFKRMEKEGMHPDHLWVCYTPGEEPNDLGYVAKCGEYAWYGKTRDEAMFGILNFIDRRSRVV